jgi:hypothetical protein
LPVNSDESLGVRAGIEPWDEHFVPCINEPDGALVCAYPPKCFEEKRSHSSIENDVETQIAGLRCSSAQTRQQRRTQAGEMLVRQNWEATIAHGFTVVSG